MKTKFVDSRLGSPVEVTLAFHRYRNNDRIAMSLNCCDTGEPWCMATVNFDELVNLPANQVAIKDYSENKGIAKLLLDNEVLEEPVLGFIEHGQGIQTRIYALSPAAYALATTSI